MTPSEQDVQHHDASAAVCNGTGVPPVRRAKLLDRQLVPVATDVFLHGLSPLTLMYLQKAVEQGLTPSGLDIGDDGIVILRFTRRISSDEDAT
jgi:hypothetical protein